LVDGDVSYYQPRPDIREDEPGDARYRSQRWEGGVNLANLDLNLLIPLDHLLRECSVTKAAARMGLGQPAVSASLAKLRRHFGDELLTRVGNRYELTPFAVHLRDRTEAALVGVERVFASEAGFDPIASQRTFRVLGSDNAMAALGGPVGRLLAERAPNARLRFELHTPPLVDAVPESLRDVDGILIPHGFLVDLPHLDVYEDTWVCLVASDNPRVGDALTLDLMAELPWVFTYRSTPASTSAARQLQTLGVEPKVQVVAESFLALPHFVTGTDRLALVPGRIAPHLTVTGEVRALPCPYDVTPLIQALWWHPMHDRDPEHQWLRSVFTEAAKQLAPP
jgi:DNA-binding transcriptional LysR family regulator